jgi:RHS repeat-associated protein
MKMKNISLFFLLVFAWSASSAQQYETVNTKVLTGTPDKSYIVNQYGILKAPFQVKASTNGTFFIRTNTTVPAEPNPEKNFVKTETPLTAVNTESALNALSSANKRTNYQYVDGLGREVQNIQMKGSFAGFDFIKYTKYDGFSRIEENRLPYAASQQNGAFRNANLDYEQANFYNGANGQPSDPQPYGQIVYEASPLNRKSKVYGAGADWHAGMGDRPIKTNVRSNVAGEVAIWVDNDASPPTTAANYPVGSLTVEEVTNEENLVTVLFKNFKGQVVLKRVGSGSTWLDNYYIYDLAGNIRFEFPPEASSRISTEYMQTGSDKQGFLDRWCFQYKYDANLRLTDKKVPGADWIYMIYDSFDRVVFTQTGNQRPANDWSFNKYDSFGRIIITGTANGARSTLESSVSAYPAVSESRTNNDLGYTNNAQPSATISSGNILTITYYDDHAFVNYTSWHPVGKAYDFIAESGGFPSSSGVFLTTTSEKVTGSKVKTGSGWLCSAIYYDAKYRAVQSIRDNHLNGQDRTTNAYDHTGQIIKTKQVHSGTGSVTILTENTYDAGGRITQTYKTIDTGPRILVSDNKYNEAGQLIEKNIHSTNGIDFLQSVDYRYNIRGQLSSINNAQLTNDGVLNNDANDVFGLEVKFTNPVVVGFTSVPRFDGSPTTVLWKTNNQVDPPVARGMGFAYDNFGRLNSHTYGTYTGPIGYTTNANAVAEDMTYDKNGNIRTLNRKVILGGASAQVDILKYKYGTNSPAFDNYGNQLTSVDDDASYWDASQNNGDFGFVELTKQANLGATNEYDYDKNGNVKIDYNKGITASGGASYSLSNKPLSIPIGGGTINFTYDALGNKLSKTVTLGGTSVQTDYVGNIQYVGGQLAFITMNDGRVVKNGSGYDYEYFIGDHMGNTRIVFGSQKETYNYRASMETERSTRETTDFKNVVRTSGPNKTSKNWETPTPTYSAALNGNVGPAKMLTVSRGDRVNLEAYANYTGSMTGTSTVVNSAMATTVAGALGLVSGEAGYTAITSNANLPTSLGNLSPSSGAPKAFIGYCLFSSDFAWSQIGFQTVSTAATAGFEKLSVPVQVPTTTTMPTPTGYMYVFVANQTSGLTVNFDEFKIIHERNNTALQVLQATDYSPFGLPLNAFSYDKQNLNSNEIQNAYKFQGKEGMSEFGLAWDDFGARQYDRKIGRFLGVDGMSDKAGRHSPYAFVFNNPVALADPDGNAPYVPYTYPIEKLNRYNYDRMMQSFAPPNEAQMMLKALYAPMFRDYMEDLYHWAGKSPRQLSPAEKHAEAMAAETTFGGKFLRQTSWIVSNIVAMTPIGAIPMALTDAREGRYGSAALNLAGSATELGALARGVRGASAISRASTAESAVARGAGVVDDVATSGNKWVFGFENNVRTYARENEGFQHLMDTPDWRVKYVDVVNDPSSEIHFLLDGIDKKPMYMIMQPNGSNTNWELHTLYQNPTAFDQTTFWFNQNFIKSSDVLYFDPFNPGH